MDAIALSPDQVKQALHESVQECIENLAFAEVSEVLRMPALGASACHAHISLGKLGHIELTADKNLLQDWTASLHCLDQAAIDDSVCKDVMLEMLNVIAGRFCGSLLGSQGDFMLGLPEWDEPIANKSEGAQGFPQEGLRASLPIQCDFVVEGRPALICRHLSG